MHQHTQSLSSPLAAPSPVSSIQSSSSSPAHLFTSPHPSSTSSSISLVSPQDQPQENSHLPHDIFTITDEALAAQYSFESEIGNGNWGSIWRISPKNPSNRLHSSSKLAIKLVYRDKSSGTTATKIKSLWSEFKILRMFKGSPHPNVLRVSSFIITPSYALLTMAIHPTMLNVKLGERSARVRRYIRGLLEGTEFLHQNRVSHNDIKPANVVISVEDQPVLIDFGFAAAYPPDYTKTTGKKAFWSTLSWGTPEYLSPQRAKSEEHDERLSDIWSLGVTLYEIVVGRTPFEANDHEEFLSKEALEVYYRRTLKGEFLGPHTLSPELRQLLVSMLRPNPKERLQSCAAGLAHAFFRRPQSSEMSVHRRALERSLVPSSLRSPGDPAAAGGVTRRVQPMGVQSPSKSNLKGSASSPSLKQGTRNHDVTPTKAKAAVKAAVYEDPQATPQSGSCRSYATPTRSILAAKSVNTPTTPRQKKAPGPDLDIKSRTGGKPGSSSARKPVPSFSKPSSQNRSAASPRSSCTQNLIVHRPSSLQQTVDEK